MIKVLNHQTMIPDNVLSADKSLLSRDFEFHGYLDRTGGVQPLLEFINNKKTIIIVPLLGLQCKQQVTRTNVMTRWQMGKMWVCDMLTRTVRFFSLQSVQLIREAKITLRTASRIKKVNESGMRRTASRWLFHLVLLFVFTLFVIKYNVLKECKFILNYMVLGLN